MQKHRVIWRIAISIIIMIIIYFFNETEDLISIYVDDFV